MNAFFEAKPDFSIFILQFNFFNGLRFFEQIGLREERTIPHLQRFLQASLIQVSSMQ